MSALWRPPDDSPFTLCPFRALTGYNCPGCGLTRGFCAVAHGEWRRAVHFNALSPLLFLTAVAAWAGAFASILKPQSVRMPLSRLASGAHVGRILLGIFGAWWVVRLALGI